MAGVVVAVIGALAIAVVVLAVLVRGQRARLAALEVRLASTGPAGTNATPPAPQPGSREAEPAGYLITRVGEPVPVAVPVAGPVAGPVDDGPVPARVDGTVFTDLLVKETVVQVAALAHGVRRALAAETRHRIRFHVRQEVKRARKQRRAEMRIAHREWTARQRLTDAAQRAPRDTAA